MSRPKASVPRKYLSLPPASQAGGSSLSRSVWSIGEWGAKSGANSAMTTIAEMMAIGIHGTRAVRRAPAARRRRHQEERGLRAAGPADCERSTTAIARTLQAEKGRIFVVLSVAKDLIAACQRHEILRCAQDDRGKHGLGQPNARVDIGIEDVDAEVD